MFNNVYRDTLQFLIDKGILEEFQGINLYIGQEPDNVGSKTSITIIPQAGFSDDPGEGGVEYPGIQFLCKSTNFDLSVKILEYIKYVLTNTVTSDFIEYIPIIPINSTWKNLPSTWRDWTLWGGENQISSSWKDLPSTWKEWVLWGGEDEASSSWKDLPATWKEWKVWGESITNNYLWKDLPSTWKDWTLWGNENVISSTWKDLPATWKNWNIWNYTQPEEPEIPPIEAIRRNTRIFGWENTSSSPALVIRDQKQRWVFSDNYIIYTNKY